MDSVKELAKQIAGYIKGKKTRAYDTAAEVRRIVGNTAYVHIPGGVPETPVKLTIDAKVGDTVQVRVANSTAWLVGNSTAPPTDDTKAKEADANAGKAMTKAKKAEAIAEEGLKEAKGTSNYFWHVDGSGAESGAHVTEIPQAEFQANPSGGNLLMQTNAVRIRRALRTYAMFSSDGMAIDPSGANYTTYGVDSVKYNYGGAKCEVSFGGETGTGKLFTKILTHIPLTLKDVDSSIEVLSNSLDTSQSSITMRTGYSTYPRQEFTMQNAKFDMRAPQTAGATNKYFTVDLDNGISTDQPIQSTKKATFGALDDGVFVLETHQILASQAIAGGAHIHSEVTFTKAGYYPLCIAGYNAPNAVFVPSRLRLKDMAVGSATVAYDIYNPRSSSGTSNFNADILWLKVSV